MMSLAAQALPESSPRSRALPCVHCAVINLLSNNTEIRIDKRVEVEVELPVQFLGVHYRKWGRKSLPKNQKNRGVAYLILLLASPLVAASHL